MAIKGIIFDYGGTIDSFGDHWSEVIYDGYVACGLPIDKEEFRTSYVYAERELAKTRHIFPQHNFLDLMQIKIRIELDDLVSRGIVAADVASEKSDAIARYCYDRARKAVAQAKPVLAALAEKYPLVLVSNFYGNVESVIRDMGIRQYFQGIIESAVVGVRKPDPRIFSLGVIALGLQPDEVLVVGDSLRKDIEPARAIGCQVAWIKGKGWTPEEDAQTDPAIIPSLAVLPQMLGCE
ncbi:MAG: HAD family hydrolase [Bacteroides sp.]|nr:HAD family hydrolase [Bacteroides sp.]MCM1413097.1 HAD family hydrolase [Bacteroides sp.]MCM1472161.1 HAD family hydrolase [Bacteroides sp.]